MAYGLDVTTLLTGLAIFGARVADVSMGTMRTISIVQGRTRTAFLLGFVEVSLWLVVISTVVKQIGDRPVLGFFYAFGFSTGNVVGILLERRLAFGHIVLRVISHRFGASMADQIRQAGFAATTFIGEGRSGPVTLIYVACRRRDLKQIIPIVKAIDPSAFYLTEPAGTVSKMISPGMQTPTGWRAIFKKK